MPTCQKCHHKWNWKQTMKASFTLDYGMTCPICREKQYLTTKARKKSAIVPFIVPAALILNLFDVPVYAVIGVFMITTIIVFGIYPFLIDLSNKEEPLW